MKDECVINILESGNFLSSWKNLNFHTFEKHKKKTETKINLNLNLFKCFLSCKQMVEKFVKTILEF